jgi:hypothetical protein
LTLSARVLQFPKLIFVYFGYNEITNIEKNLFENNPKLVQINFYDNNIKHVGYDLLKGLNDLEEVDFRVNPCVNKRARNQTEIQEMIRLLPITCPPLGTETTSRTTPSTTTARITPTTSARTLPTTTARITPTTSARTLPTTSARTLTTTTARTAMTTKTTRKTFISFYNNMEEKQKNSRK